jgi:hypothetical protein
VLNVVTEVLWCVKMRGDASSRSANWLTLMQKFCVQIPRWRNRDRLEDLANVTPVITAMGDDVKENLLARHPPTVTIGKSEIEYLSRLLFR